MNSNLVINKIAQDGGREGLSLPSTLAKDIYKFMWKDRNTFSAGDFIDPSKVKKDGGSGSSFDWMGALGGAGGGLAGLYLASLLFPSGPKKKDKDGKPVKESTFNKILRYAALAAGAAGGAYGGYKLLASPGPSEGSAASFSEKGPENLAKHEAEDTLTGSFTRDAMLRSGISMGGVLAANKAQDAYLAHLVKKVDPSAWQALKNTYEGNLARNAGALSGGKGATKEFLKRMGVLTDMKDRAARETFMEGQRLIVNGSDKVGKTSKIITNKNVGRGLGVLAALASILDVFNSNTKARMLENGWEIKK